MSANDTPRDSADDEALRREIQAAIKAGRELDPEMDSHLADSVLDRYRQEQAARNKALGRPQTPAAPQRVATPGMPGMVTRSGIGVGNFIVPTVVVIAVVVVLAVNWHLFWLLFCLPWLLGGWFGWGRHHGPRNPHGPHEARRYMRIERMRSELGQPQSGNTIHYD